MDAARNSLRFTRLISLLTVAALDTAGCTWLQPAPAPRNDSAAPPPSEPPQVVQTPEAPPPPAEDSLDERVRKYIERIDDPRRRAELAARSRTADRERSLSHAAHAGDDSGDPAEPAPVAVGTSGEHTPGRESRVVDRAASPGQNSAQDGAERASDEKPAAANPESTPPPPAVVDVSVRAAAPAPPPRGVDSKPPGVNSPAAARAGISSLREFLEQTPRPTDEASFQEQLDARLAWLAAGDYERARQPLTFATAEQQKLASGLVEAWVAVREGHMGDLSAAASAAARELDALRESLRRLSDLSIPQLVICRSVRGFGQYDAIEPARFPAGAESEFVLYCELRDFVSEKADDGTYQTRFDMTTTILTRSGDVSLELKDTDVVDRCRNRRQDCFIPRLVRLPATLAPGPYVAKITIADKLGKKVAENRVAFQIVAGQ
jgi:hypothetical protein